MGMLKQAEQTAPTADEQTSGDNLLPQEGQTPAEPDDQETAPGSESQPDASQGADEGQPEVRMATPEEQKQYESVLAMLYQIMYENEGSSKAVVNHIKIADKMGSIVKAVMIIVHQINLKIKMTPPVLAQLTQDATDRVIELAERVKKINFSEQETLVTLAAAQDAVEKATGVSLPNAPQNSAAGGTASESASPQTPEASPAAEPSPAAQPATPQAAPTQPVIPGAQ